MTWVEHLLAAWNIVLIVLAVKGLFTWIDEIYEYRENKRNNHERY